VDRDVDWVPGNFQHGRAACALAGGISAAHALAGLERTYGKEKVCGSIQ
jgi:hypothetical protein